MLFCFKIIAITGTLLLGSIQNIWAYADKSIVPSEYLEIRHVMGKGDYNKAHLLVNRFIAKTNVYLPAYQAAALIYIYEGQHEEGIAFFDSLLSLGKNVAEVAGALASIYHTYGKPLKSFEYSKQALQNNCQTVSPYVLYIKKNNEIEYNDVVETFLNKQIQNFPDNWRYRYALASWHTDNKRITTACDILRTLLDNDIQHWRIYYLLAMNLNYMKQFKLSQDAYNKGIAYCKKNHDKEGLAYLFEGLSKIQINLVQSDSARYAFDRSMALAREIGNIKLEIRLLLNRGRGLIHRNQWTKARQNIHRAKSLARKYSEGFYVFLAYYALGDLELETGHWNKASKNYLAAYHTADSIGRKKYIPQMLYCLSVVDARAGRKEEALKEFSQVEDWLKKDGGDFQNVLYLRNRATLFFELSRYDEALQKIDDALTVSKKRKDVRELLKLRLLKGNILIHTGQLQQAYSILKLVIQQANHAEYISQRVEGQIYIAALELKRNNISKAKTILTNTLHTLPETPEYLLHLHAINLLAQTNLYDENFKKAISIYESAIDIIDMHTANLSTGNLTSFSEKERDIFFGLGRVLLQAGQTTDALKLTERARDIIVQRKQWQALLLSETNMDSPKRSLLTKTDSLLLKLRLQKAAMPSTADTQILEAAIKGLQYKRMALLDSILDINQISSYKHDALDLVQFREYLASRHEAAISFFVGDSTSLTFLVAGDTIVGKEIKIGRKGLSTLLSEINPLFKPYSNNDPSQYSTRIDTSAAHSAYQILLADILKGRQENSLAIVPDNILHALPFDLLMSPDSKSDGLQYLIQRYTLRNGLSLRSLMPDSTHILDVSSLLVVANPWLPDDPLASNYRNTISQRSLKETSREVQAIGGLTAIHTLLTKHDVSHQRLAQALPDADWIHMASHSYSRAGEPLFSEIVLSAPEDNQNEPEKLYAFEIFQMRLKAKLAILSGCETGRGNFLDGEGFEGFVQAFRAAGTPSIIASLWNVEDRATADFFTYYYKSLIEMQSSTRALQAAKLKMLQDPNYSFLNWAAFSYYGYDWITNLEPTPPQTISWLVIISVIGIIIFVVIALVIMRKRL